jgi:hypothetical protein
MRERVYIAGPYTKGDVAVNVRNAIHAADQVWDLGFAPYVPHLTHFWHLISPKPYEEWLKIDAVWLDVCHYFIRLEGESAGADVEEAVAREKGIPVYRGVAHFRAMKGPAT